MPGSGKTVAAEVLREMGLKVFSMGDVVRSYYEKLKNQGESIMEFAKRIRRERGNGIVAEWLVELISEIYDSVIGIEGVRNWEEVEIFRRIGDIIIVAIHAPPKVRYERILRRSRKYDPYSMDEVIKRDLEELKLGIGTVIALSDYIIVNDGELENFKKLCKEIFLRIING